MKGKEITGGVRSQSDSALGEVFTDWPMFIRFLYKIVFLAVVLSFLLMFIFAPFLFEEYASGYRTYSLIILAGALGVVLVGTFPIGFMWFLVWKLAIRALLAAGLKEQYSIVVMSFPTVFVVIHFLFSFSKILIFGAPVETLLSIDKPEIWIIMLGLVLVPIFSWNYIYEE